jgi:hypothetical protein
MAAYTANMVKEAVLLSNWYPCCCFGLDDHVDWLAEAIDVEKHAIFIFRAEVISLAWKGPYIYQVVGGEVWRKGATWDKWGRNWARPMTRLQVDIRRRVGRTDIFGLSQGPLDRAGSSVWDCLCSLKSWMRGFHAQLREKPSSLLMFWGWCSIFIAFLKIQSVCLVSHHRLLRMVQVNVSMMFFNPCLNQVSSLFIVHSPTFTEDAVNTWHFQSQIILNGLKRAGGCLSLWWELKFLHQTWDSEWQILLALNPPIRDLPQHHDDPPSVAFLPLAVVTFNRISTMLSKHNIRVVDLPPRKLSSILWPMKDDLALKTPGVYSIPCEYQKAYIGQTGCLTETRVKEYHRHIHLYHPEMSAMAKHSINLGHWIWL